MRGRVERWIILDETHAPDAFDRMWGRGLVVAAKDYEGDFTGSCGVGEYASVSVQERHGLRPGQRLFEVEEWGNDVRRIGIWRDGIRIGEADVPDDKLWRTELGRNWICPDCDMNIGNGHRCEGVK